MAPAEAMRPARGPAPGSGWDSVSMELQEKLTRRLQRNGEVTKGTQVGLAALQGPVRDAPAGCLADLKQAVGDPDAGEPSAPRQPEAALLGESCGPACSSTAPPDAGDAADGLQRPRGEELCSELTRVEHSRGCCSRLGFCLMWLAAFAAALYCLPDQERWMLNHLALSTEALSKLQPTGADFETCRRDGALDGLFGLAAQPLNAGEEEGRLQCGRLMVQARRQRLLALARAVVFAIVAVASLCTVLLLACCRRVVGKLPVVLFGALAFAVAAAAIASAEAG